MPQGPFKTIGIGVIFSPYLKANIFETSRLALAFKSKLILFHVLINKNIMLFVRNVFKPNVIIYKELGSDGNYYKQKDKLDNIPEDQNIVLDFSFREFVDHKVMDNLNVYRMLCVINE
ncbi:hypothetical protein FBALC1_17067 [Flavobacteriales bacterium ALC-1]|nr:hypothetical protein FBALC1_17067 [Flavobacteriales bacterium ALC-1]